MAFVKRLKNEAKAEYRLARLEYAVVAPHLEKKTDPPRVPEILRGK